MEQSLKKVFKNISAQPLKIRQLQRSFQPHLRFQLSKELSFFSRCAYCLSSSRDKVECFRVFLWSKMLCCDWWGFFYGCHRRVSFLDVTELFPRRCAVVPPFFFFFFLSWGIHAWRISIPLSLLVLLGWRLMWIASLILLVCQWGSRLMNLTSF